MRPTVTVGNRLWTFLRSRPLRAFSGILCIPGRPLWQNFGSEAELAYVSRWRKKSILCLQGGGLMLQMYTYCCNTMEEWLPGGSFRDQEWQAIDIMFELDNI